MKQEIYHSLSLEGGGPKPRNQPIHTPHFGELYAWSRALMAISVTQYGYWLFICSRLNHQQVQFDCLSFLYLSQTMKQPSTQADRLICNYPDIKSTITPRCGNRVTERTMPKVFPQVGLTLGIVRSVTRLPHLVPILLFWGQKWQNRPAKANFDVRCRKILYTKRAKFDLGDSIQDLKKPLKQKSQIINFPPPDHCAGGD